MIRILRDPQGWYAIQSRCPCGSLTRSVVAYTLGSALVKWRLERANGWMVEREFHVHG